MNVMCIWELSGDGFGLSRESGSSGMGDVNVIGVLRLRSSQVRELLRSG
jgi:hypothetical protein